MPSLKKHDRPDIMLFMAVVVVVLELMFLVVRVDCLSPLLQTPFSSALIAFSGELLKEVGSQ